MNRYIGLQNCIVSFSFVPYLKTIIKNIQYSPIPPTNYLENHLGLTASFWLYLVMEAIHYTTGNELFFKDQKSILVLKLTDE